MMGVGAFPSIEMTVFFTSDLHFGHNKICALTGRPFSSVEEMDSVLVENWNNIVTKHDGVYILGDFSFHNVENTIKILRALRGNKVLIKGNHDRGVAKYAHLFSAVKDYQYAKIAGHKIAMSHFPMLSWEGMQEGSFMFHGHSHGNLVLPDVLKNGRIVDVGVDAMAALYGKRVGDYRPYSIEEIMANTRMAVAGDVVVDHHS